MIEAARRRKYEQQRRGEGKERSDRSDRDRDRDRRERGDKEKSSRPSRRMDIIDQLDATSIYGTGGMSLFSPTYIGLVFTNMAQFSIMTVPLTR
jgi:hypothetical protein